MTTKQSVTRFSAHHLHPEHARELIREAAQEAVVGVEAERIRPARVAMPVELDVELQTADMAEVASWVKGVERTGTRAVQISASDGHTALRSFVALTYIARQVGGR